MSELKKPINIELAPYGATDPVLGVHLAGSEISVRLKSPVSSLSRSVQPRDAASQAAWMLAMAEAAGGSNLLANFLDELVAARTHIEQKRKTSEGNK